jgi:hypothetical protein
MCQETTQMLPPLKNDMSDICDKVINKILNTHTHAHTHARAHA